MSAETDLEFAKIDRESSEDSMVAALLALKAAQLAGQIGAQRFRVYAMRVILCSQQKGCDDSVFWRVMEGIGDDHGKGPRQRPPR